MSLNEPEAILKVARELRRKLMQLPESDRRITGDSKLIPPILSKLNPVEIHANENVLQVQLFRYYEKSFGLFAFPENSNKQVGEKMIIDGLWWLEF
ncbi:hypothetical protein OAG68_01800 [bacterium]|nr:hypothetical protein [bacterium]